MSLAFYRTLQVLGAGVFLVASVLMVYEHGKARGRLDTAEIAQHLMSECETMLAPPEQRIVAGMQGGTCKVFVKTFDRSTHVTMPFTECLQLLMQADTVLETHRF